MLCEYGGGNSNLSEIPVLILVLMEDALRVAHHRQQVPYVLILVLMEDALRAYTTSNTLDTSVES